VTGDKLLLIAGNPLCVFRLAAKIFIGPIACGKSSQILRGGRAGKHTVAQALQSRLEL
jgi:hypothetical protein